jgi:stress response protein SCP2
MTEMSMGSNVPIPAATIRASLRWTAGPGIPDVDGSAILLEENGEVGSDADFVFYNQPQHYSGAVRMGGKTPGPQPSDSVDVELARVPADYQRIVLVASADGGTFGQVPGLQLVLTDLGTGQPIAAFPMQAGAETAFLSAELYRRDGGWKFRAVGQGYSAGLAGLAADFGIDVGAAAPAPEPSAAVAAPAAAAAPPPLDLSAPAPATTPPAATAPPASFGLDLSGDDSGVGLLLPVVNDLPPEFQQQTAAPLAPPAPPVAPAAYPPVQQPWQPPPPAQPPAQPAAQPAWPAPPIAATPTPPPGYPQAPAGGLTLNRNEGVDLTHTSAGPLTRVVFSLGWTPAQGRSDVDLDASVIAFDSAAEKLAVVWYLHKNEFSGALQHTGDNRQGGAGGDAEQILIDLVRLPADVTSLVFTINSFRKQTFTDIANAYCAVRDVETGEPLARFDLSDTQPSTAVLMAELRRSEQPGLWRVRAIGEFHDCRTVKKLVPAAARQVKIG